MGGEVRLRKGFWIDYETEIDSCKQKLEKKNMKKKLTKFVCVCVRASQCVFIAVVFVGNGLLSSDLLEIHLTDIFIVKFNFLLQK